MPANYYQGEFTTARRQYGGESGGGGGYRLPPTNAGCSTNGFGWDEKFCFKM